MLEPNRQTLTRVIIAVLIVGIALRSIQYFANASLYLDEALLVLSVVNRSLPDLLLHPLASGQVAPPMFLFFTKVGGMLSGNSELGLRAFAFLSAVGCLILFVPLSRMVLSGFAVPFAVALMALSPKLIFYSAQVKQYSTDTLVAVLMTILALKLVQSDFSARDAKLGAAAGAVAVWFSQAGVIVLTGLGLALAVIAIGTRSRRVIRLTALIGIVWATAALAATLFALRMMALATRAGMSDFWELGFMPFPPRSLADLVWLPRVFKIQYLLALNMTGVGDLCIVVAVLGIIALWKRERPQLLILAFPVLVACVLSAAKLYPLSERLILFMIPTIAIALAAGAEWIASMIPQRAAVLRPVPFLIFLIPSATRLARGLPPWPDGELKPALRHVAQAKLRGDIVYIDNFGVPATQYYEKRVGFNRADWIGQKPQKDVNAEVAELSRYKRAWVVVTHAYMDPDIAFAMPRHLDSTAVRLDSSTFHEAAGSRGSIVYLYDLSARAH